MRDDDTEPMKVPNETDPNTAPGEPDPRRRAVVAQLYPDQDYGFLLTPEYREVRFTRDTVLRDEFDELRIGSEVRYSEADGDVGPDATAVELVSTPYPTADEAPEPLGDEDEVPEMPDTWQEK